jgi:hypothetical protein
MNAIDPNLTVDDHNSLGQTLHGIRDDLSAARVAAMQVLVFQMQAETSEADHVSAEDFMQAVAEVGKALDGLQNLHSRHLAPLGIDLPEEVAEQVQDVSADLSELMRILNRCTHAGEEGIRGFDAGADLYDLCCNRVAKGINELSSSMSGFFLELSEKEKAEELDRTNKIALEIGKIGRVINMVATNASIEAARVGDAGKGFTVIADEVKTLSTRVSALSVSLTDRLQ